MSSSSSSESPEPKKQKLDEEEDGWHDHLDKEYDWAAKNEKFDQPDSMDLTPGEKEYHMSIYRTRGFDPYPESYIEDDPWRYLFVPKNRVKREVKDDGEVEEEEEEEELTQILLAEEWAQFACLMYNRLEKAEEKGNPTTPKVYQTRVLVGPDLGIQKICSFRPKPPQ